MPNKSCVNNSKQQSMVKLLSDEVFRKTSGQAANHKSKVILKKTNEYDKLRALGTGPETQIELEQKNENYVNNLKQNGSSPSGKRKSSGTSNNTTAKVHIVAVAKKESNTPHQVEDTVVHGMEKSSVQIIQNYKNDSPEKNAVLPCKNSKDIEVLSKKKKVPQELPLILHSSKPSLHRSERVCIKVFSSKAKTLTQENCTKNLVRNKKESVWLYQNPCKERLKQKKEGKTSHGPPPLDLAYHQEDRESNNNTAISSLSSPKPSCKNEVRLASASHIKDKLKHSSSRSEKYKLDINNCTIPKANESVPVLKSSEDKNSCAEGTSGRHHKVSSTSVKKAKNKNIENSYNKETVDETPENSRDGKKCTNKQYHKPLTPKSAKVELDDKKKGFEKTRDKSLMFEENKLLKKSKLSSPVSGPERCVNKTVPGVTPNKQGTPCKKPKEKKQKLTFEELMNYDASSLGHS
ncbi:hypothetical protein E2C01_020423 [Portunus trituberculatus]|uniref:Uncharacterized protein n=2 Tax=Portunus trituberculatus TaxID=210409 RepID=A0A5B7E1G1_PORTR|nr:hypothetical protein [Portunus trituberculatus]